MSVPEKCYILGFAGYAESHIADELLAIAKDVVIYVSHQQGLKLRVYYLSQKYMKVIPMVAADVRNRNTCIKL